MKKKILISILSTFVLCSLFTGCGKEVQEGDDTQIQETQETQEIKKTNIMELTATDYINNVEYEGVVDFSSILIDEDEIKENIETYLSYYSVYEHITEGTVESDSIVNIDYVGTIDGIEFNGGSAKNVLLDISNNSYIDGFADGIISANVGDVVTLNLKFPEDYEGSFTDGDGVIKNLAEQDVKFDITINYICGDQILDFTAMNDEYAYDLTGGYYNTLEDLISGTEHDILHQKVSNLEIEMWDTLVKNISIVEDKKDEVEKLVNDEYEYEIAYYTQMAAYYETDLATLVSEQLGYDDEDSFREFTKENAQYVVYQNLIVDYLAEVNDLVLTDEQYEESGAKLAEEYGYETLEDFIVDYEEVDIKEYLQYDIVSEFLIKANGYTHED